MFTDWTGYFVWKRSHTVGSRVYDESKKRSSENYREVLRPTTTRVLHVTAVTATRTSKYIKRDEITYEASATEWIQSARNANSTEKRRKTYRYSRLSSKNVQLSNNCYNLLQRSSWGISINRLVDMPRIKSWKILYYTITMIEARTNDEKPRQNTRRSTPWKRRCPVGPSLPHNFLSDVVALLHLFVTFLTKQIGKYVGNNTRRSAPPTLPGRRRSWPHFVGR